MNANSQNDFFSLTEKVSTGAYLEEKGGGRRVIQTRTPDKNGLTVVTSRSHRSGEGDYLKAFCVLKTINCGSSLKFCLVAAGQADIYPRLGPTSEWDTAAGHAVLISAGGEMTQLDGKPFIYGKNDVRNPFFVARGQPRDANEGETL